MSKPISILERFLQRNSVNGSSDLPLVHTTRSYNLRDIYTDQQILAGNCDVFLNEKLNYFFVGRPSYKYYSDEVEDAHWEFPSCFIFEFNLLEDIRRVFPFDSGAFDRGMYPDYINRIKLDNFMAGVEPDTPRKIIGAFFENSEKYFHMMPKATERFDAEYSIGPMDAELSALNRLAGDRSVKPLDDRRFTIEMQSGRDVNLSIHRPIAVICPYKYLGDKDFVSVVEEEWKARIVTYQTYSLNVGNIYGQIYAKVEEVYRDLGYL